MKFITSFNALTRLYKKELSKINAVHFTAREIDVISCILHQRGEKKIASLLLVSPRTVSAHVHNIMNKLGCNARDQIIDFIEHSGKLAILREYYLHLIIKSSFEQILSKISHNINRKPLDCYYFIDAKLEYNSKLLQIITKHLERANIKLLLSHNKLNTNGDDNHTVIDIERITTDGYYHNFLLVLSDLLPQAETKKYIDEFNKIYDDLVNSHNTPQQPVELSQRKSVKKYYVPVIVVTLFIILIVFLKQREQRRAISNDVNHEVSIQNLEDFINKWAQQNFTANNIDPKQLSTNHELIKNIEKLFEDVQEGAISQYFAQGNMDAALLASYIYNLQSLAAYYTYHQHDGAKAQKILFSAKETIENYLMVRSIAKINFSELSPEETFAELNTVKCFPQIYARVIYLIGRSYIYNQQLNEGEKYFLTAKFLSQKTGLFEGYLSDVSGLLRIKRQQILDDPNENSINALVGIARKYALYRDDQQTYITQYNPNVTQQRMIQPGIRDYDIFFCGLKQIELYKDILFLTRINDNINDYIKRINLVLFSTEQSTDIQHSLLKLLNNVPQRRVADLYNYLAQIFHILDQKNISASQEIERLYKLMSEHQANTNDTILTNKFASKYLLIAERLFIKARSISRNSDYTKADAYQGLAKLYDTVLMNNPEALSSDHKQQILHKYNDAQKKAAELNNALGR